MRSEYTYICDTSRHSQGAKVWYEKLLLTSLQTKVPHLHFLPKGVLNDIQLFSGVQSFPYTSKYTQSCPWICRKLHGNQHCFAAFETNILSLNKIQSLAWIVLAPKTNKIIGGRSMGASHGGTATTNLRPIDTVLFYICFGCLFYLRFIHRLQA